MQEKLAQALTVAVAALCTMQSVRYDNHLDRDQLFSDTLSAVREIVGPDHRITSMPRKCMCCGEGQGTKEGNGATGETATICPPCMTLHFPAEAAIIRQGVGV